MRTYTDYDYKKVEAMSRRGCDIDYIVKSMPHLCKFETIDIIQKIEALDRIREEKRNRVRAY